MILQIVEENHAYFSSILFTWEVPDDNSRIEYYQFQLMDETTVITHNTTTNTSATVSGIPYNKNVTLLLLAHNCIGNSTPVIKTRFVGMIIIFYSCILQLLQSRVCLHVLYHFACITKNNKSAYMYTTKLCLIII